MKTFFPQIDDEFRNFGEWENSSNEIYGQVGMKQNSDNLFLYNMQLLLLY